MSNLLHEILRQKKLEMSDNVVCLLRNSGTAYYQRMELDVLQKRAEQLVDSFVESVRTRPAVFMGYLEHVAEERIVEGVFLRDIQTALQILEEKAWQIVVEDILPDDQVQYLGRITTIVGAAKDQIARIYLRRWEKAELNSALLQQRVYELAKGTDPAPIDEEDLQREMQAEK